MQYAYQAGWKKFIPLALTKFSLFAGKSAYFAGAAERMWLFILTETKDEFVDEVTSILDRYVDRISLLMSVKDTSGRKAIDVATPKYKYVILQRSYLFRRYNIRDGPAEHVSATCVVWIGKDHKDDTNIALKFFCKRDHFEREKLARLNCRFDGKYVISTLRLHDGEEDKLFGDEAEKKGYYRYCLVMPAAERNLGTVLVHEHIAGRDWDTLKLISKQLIEALHHVHENGYIHGDVKRKNMYLFNVPECDFCFNLI